MTTVATNIQEQRLIQMKDMKCGQYGIIKKTNLPSLYQDKVVLCTGTGVTLLNMPSGHWPKMKLQTNHWILILQPGDVITIAI